MLHRFKTKIYIQLSQKEAHPELKKKKKKNESLEAILVDASKKQVEINYKSSSLLWWKNLFKIPSIQKFQIL